MRGNGRNNDALSVVHGYYVDVVSFYFAFRAIVPGKIVIISSCTLPLGMVITVIGFFVNGGTAHLVIACIGCVCTTSVGY